MSTQTTVVQSLHTNISDDAMAEHIDAVVRARSKDEHDDGIMPALEFAIKEIHGNVAYVYGRFGDMAATRILQGLLSGIAEATADIAPEVKH